MEKLARLFAHARGPRVPSVDWHALAARARVHRLELSLEALSYLYLFVPVFLFLIGWLRFPMAALVSLPLFLGVGLSFLHAARAPMSCRDAPDWSAALGPARLTVVLLVCLAAVIAAGIGGVIHQFDDYCKHNMVYKFLTELPWPAAFEAMDSQGQEQTAILPYYFGYYLVPAALGKLFGWAVTYLTTLLWGWLGATLAVLWYLRLMRSGSPWYVLLFFFFGGLDIVGLLFVPSGYLAPLAGGQGRLELLQWAMSKGQLDWLWPAISLIGAPDELGGHVVWYPSQMTRLLYGPHHTLTGWIVVLMVMHDSIHRNTCERLGLLWVALPFHSLFAGAGAAAVVALASLAARFRRCISWENLSAIPALALALLYFSSANASVASSLLWQSQDLAETWPFLLLLGLSAFGLYALAAPRTGISPLAPGPVWWWGSLLLLAVVPIVSVGFINDLGTHALLGPWTVFLVCLGIACRSGAQRPQPWRTRVLCVLLVVGALGSAGIFRHALWLGLEPGTPPLAKIRWPNEMVPRSWLIQVTGDMDALFWRRLAKTPRVHPELAIPVVQTWSQQEARSSQDWTGPLLADGGTALEPGLPVLRYEGASFPASQVSGIAIWTRVEEMQPPGAWSSGSLRLTWTDDSHTREATGQGKILRQCRLVPRRVGDYVVWEQILLRYTYWKGEIQAMEFAFDFPAAMEFTISTSRIDFLER